MAINIPGVNNISKAPKSHQVPKFAPAKDGDDDDDVMMNQRSPGNGGNRKAAPRVVNVDDIPVGGGGGGPLSPHSGSTPRAGDNVHGKKVAKVEEYHLDNYDKAHAKGSGSKSKAHAKAHNPYPDEGSDDDDRPIRPKNTFDYNDRDPVVEADGGPSNADEGSKERFAPGQHPLEGVAGFDELPAPESLAGKARYCHNSHD